VAKLKKEFFGKNAKKKSSDTSEDPGSKDI